MKVFEIYHCSQCHKMYTRKLSNISCCVDLGGGRFLKKKSEVTQAQLVAIKNILSIEPVQVVTLK